jgi:hypothetical protein
MKFGVHFATQIDSPNRYLVTAVRKMLEANFSIGIAERNDERSG